MSRVEAAALAALSISDAEEARRRLNRDVVEASRIFTGTWPLQDFISGNPLEGLIDEPFTEAARIAGQLLGSRVMPPETWMRELYKGGRITDADLRRALQTLAPRVFEQSPITVGSTVFEPDEIILVDLLHGLTVPTPKRTQLTLAQRLDSDVASRIETHVITYLGGYFGEGQSTWSMPARESGLFAAWRGLAPHTPRLPRRTRACLRAVDAEPQDALLHALAELGVPESERVEYLRCHLSSLPGWTARIRGRQEYPAHEIADLLEYLAMRVSVEAAFLVPAHAGTTAYEAARWIPVQAPVLPGPRERAAHVLSLLSAEAMPEDRDVVADLLIHLPLRRRELIWLEAYEGHYRDDLLAAMDGQRALSAAPAAPFAQVACCIDNRAEGLRRHLEETGPYQTMGFAGFFSVAMRFAPLLSPTHRHQHPGPGTSQFDLTEAPTAGHERENARHLAGRQMAAAVQSSWHTAEEVPGAPFVLAEATGWAAGPIAAARTLAPRASSALLRKATGRLTPEATTEVTLDALTPDQRVQTAVTILTLLGLTDGFARLVVFTGHSATTTNNPYQAVLDCGACGGHPGAPNARAAAELLNRADVREALVEHGIRIPASTLFLAAEHNTTTDDVAILDAHLIPADHADDVARLRADLETAGEQLALERVATLPAAKGRRSARDAVRHVRTRSVDWAQAFPEWGLAGNTATIIAPRALTRGVNLDCRVFLHDYDHYSDADGSVLETLLMGPTIVAQWISCQYYFSAVDHQKLGAGSKTLHNVVGGGLGVMAGPTTDLQVGLPWQSLSDGIRLRHEPMRMLTLVEAPTSRLDEIIERNPMLRDLAANAWITLCARESDDEPWLRYSPTGWNPLIRG